MKKGYLKDPVSNEKFLPESQGGTGTIGGGWVIFIAASDAPQWQKDMADIVCDGVNDELSIQSACDNIYAIGGGTVKLSQGTFFIDSFPNYDANDDGGSYTAIMIPSDNISFYSIKIEGSLWSANTNKDTVIRVSESCYEGLDSSMRYKIFRSPYNNNIIGTAKVALYMESMNFFLPWNQKRIMCIDLRYTNKVDIRFINIRAYTSGYNGRTVDLFHPVDPAIEGCVGIRMMGGGNSGLLQNFRNINIVGCYEGFQMGAEHIIALNLGTSYCVYGYTFGNYQYQGNFIHPITMINCGDENNVNGPLFAHCGDYRYESTEDGGQQITIIDFTFERYAELTPGGVLGNLARELRPGHFHGEISYTIQDGTKNSKKAKFWEDGHGQRFITRNSAHLLAGNSTERRSYAPNYLQRYWDTTVGKELVCTDTANKTWRDTAGNIVS